MARYWKAIAALLTGLATAGALLPTNAPTWLLALGVGVQTAAVFLVRNKQAPVPPSG